MNFMSWFIKIIIFSVLFFSFTKAKAQLNIYSENHLTVYYTPDSFADSIDIAIKYYNQSKTITLPNGNLWVDTVVNNLLVISISCGSDCTEKFFYNLNDNKTIHFFNIQGIDFENKRVIIYSDLHLLVYDFDYNYIGEVNIGVYPFHNALLWCWIEDDYVFVEWGKQINYYTPKYEPNSIGHFKIE